MMISQRKIISRDLKMHSGYILGSIFAILTYLLYTSFKRGMALQQENELTI